MGEIENWKKARRPLDIGLATASPQSAIVAGGKLQLRGWDIEQKPGRSSARRHSSGAFDRANVTIRSEPPAQVRLIALLVSVRETPVRTKGRPQGKRLSGRAESPPRAPSAKSRKPSPTVLAYLSLILERDGPADSVRIRNAT
jgi:hypothetical protein